MLETPFTPWPNYTCKEADAVSRVLLSNKVNYWTGGECRQFEKEFLEWAGSQYAVALANGTVALDLALHVLDIGPGDEVVVAPRTFIASVSCVANAGAKPVFADVDRDSQNITANPFEQFSRRAREPLFVSISQECPARWMRSWPLPRKRSCS